MVPSSKIVFKLVYRPVGNVKKANLVIIFNYLKSHLGLEGSVFLVVHNTFTYVTLEKSRTWIYLLKGEVRNMLSFLTVSITGTAMLDRKKGV